MYLIVSGEDVQIPFSEILKPNSILWWPCKNYEGYGNFYPFI